MLANLICVLLFGKEPAGVQGVKAFQIAPNVWVDLVVPDQVVGSRWHTFI